MTSIKWFRNAICELNFLKYKSEYCCIKGTDNSNKHVFKFNR